MAIKKEHPLYNEYIAKCWALAAKYEAEETAITAKYPECRGLDHPAGVELRALTLRENAELRDLQKEYAFLFDPIEQKKKDRTQAMEKRKAGVSWLLNLVQYYDNGDVGECPSCGSQNVEVLKHVNGTRMAITFSCKECGLSDHFDGFMTEGGFEA